MPTEEQKLQRFKLTLAYRGSRYHGWQTQPAMQTWTGKIPPPGHGIPTIQETVQRAIVLVVRHPIILSGSSRTDSGVHAKGQVAHFDSIYGQIPKDSLRKAINHQLPGDILIRHIAKVPDTFDAVTSTLRKRYQYAIWNTYDRGVFTNDLIWHRWQPLNLEAMREAASYFVGTQDFVSFARPGHGRESTIRTIYSCDVRFKAPKMVIGIEGSGFLWNMVRIIVGTLVQVGIGHYKPSDILKMLAAKNRQAAGPTAPPHGLYLQWIQTTEDRADRDAEHEPRPATLAGDPVRL